MNSNLLFIGSKFVYSQTIYKKFFFSVIKRFINIKSGIFTNFFVTSYKLIDKLNFDSNPSCIFFFNLRRNNLILLESKKENIPSIGIASSNLNVSLLDYPIFVNSLYFYSTFFLSKFFFKLILLNK
jgi:ribosomal protein S2